MSVEDECMADKEEIECEDDKSERMCGIGSRPLYSFTYFATTT